MAAETRERGVGEGVPVGGAEVGLVVPLDLRVFGRRGGEDLLVGVHVERLAELVELLLDGVLVFAGRELLVDRDRLAVGVAALLPGEPGQRAGLEAEEPGPEAHLVGVEPVAEVPRAEERLADEFLGREVDAGAGVVFRVFVDGLALDVEEAVGGVGEVVLVRVDRLVEGVAVAGEGAAPGLGGGLGGGHGRGVGGGEGRGRRGAALPR